MRHDDLHDQGLQRDLQKMLGLTDRRQILGWFVSAAAIPLVGCGDPEDTDGEALTDTSAPGGTCDPGEAIPEETAGPYPGDGSNGVNALELSGIVRKDIRPSIDGGTGTAEGVLLTIRLRVMDNSACTPLAGYAVYLWHCDRDGNYSMYTAAAATYLRGVQVSDADGWVEFTSIFPGCYPGRWPHIHFEVYPSVEATSRANNNIATSQIALPEAPCNLVYATSGYESSPSAMSQTMLSTDNVFSDGAEKELASVTGDADAGFVAELIVPVEV